MSDFLDRDTFTSEGSDTSYGSHTIEEEKDIFQPEEDVKYEPPVQETSVFDHPTYRENAYEDNQSQYGSYHFTARQIRQDNLNEETTNTFNKAEDKNNESVTSETVNNTHGSGQVSGTEKAIYTEQTTAGSVNPQSLDSQNNTEHQSDSKKKSSVRIKKRDKKKGGFGKKLLTCAALAVVFGLVSGGVFLGVAKFGADALGIGGPSKNNPPVIGSVGDNHEVENPKPEVSGTVTTADGTYSVAQVAERCMPAMVGITNKSIQEVPNYFGFGSQNYESESSGSGIIIGQTETELLIATNNHVVSGANTLTVCFVDDELVNAIIKGTDADNDLAVISVQLSEIKEETLGKIKVIELGDSESLQVGEQVVAIGNALGYGQSVSSGWVSALNREVVIDNTTLTLIQTDAAINPGNSGGALLNMKGELIGINESKYADTAVEGMGYAIPISTATPILSNLMTRETRYKVDEEKASYLGISCKDISAEFAEMYNVPTGVYVDSVVEGGPAAAAGIQKGDIITSFDGSKTASYSDLIGLLEYYAAGEIVDIVYYRTNNGVYTEQTTSVVLGARSESDLENQESQSQDAQNSQGENGGGSESYGFPGGGFDIFDFFGY